MQWGYIIYNYLNALYIYPKKLKVQFFGSFILPILTVHINYSWIGHADTN